MTLLSVTFSYIPQSLCLILISFLYFRQWLEDALRENEPDSSFIFLVGTKKDLVVSKLNADKEIGFLLVPQVISFTSCTQCC